MELILIAFLGYRIHLLAKMKEQNSVLWIILSVVAFFFGEMIGFVLVLFAFTNGAVNMNMFNDTKNMDATTKQLVQIVYENPVHPVLITLCGFGGYLLIRYILNRIPNKKDDNNVHWMDKVNQNQQ